MSEKGKRHIKRILAAGIIFLLAVALHYRVFFAKAPGWESPVFNFNYLEFFAFLVAYLVIGWDIIWEALQNIRRGRVFDENFLMTVASIGAFILGEYGEGTAVMLLYQVGELFESYAVSRSRTSIARLMDIRPDYANVKRDGKLIRVEPEEVSVGEIIVVRPGERIPLDGVVIEGSSVLDTSVLTGESLPRDVYTGEDVFSGCINQTGMLAIQVSKEFGQSTVAKILELVENASEKKSKSENFITRFARYYTPVVVYAALVLAVIPPLVTKQPFAVWIERALIFLVISCPCALVISVPLTFFGGIGGASKAGVLVKGSSYLEMLANTETVVFDKTGTLTKGNFVVSEVCAHNMTKQKLLDLAAHAESISSHPIADGIKNAYGKNIDSSRIADVEEIVGYGLRAVIDGKEVLIGSAKFMEKRNVVYQETAPDGTVVHLAVNGKYVGYIKIADEIKADSQQAMLDLKEAGIKELIMLTGDTEAVGQKVAAQLNLDKASAGLLPADKVEKLEELLAEKGENGVLAYVGDGINDAPVLARADVGIAMGGLGSDAAIEAADVVIMTDEPSKIATIIKISKKTLRIARQNIVFALLVKGVVMLLGALGYANMWAAVFADVGVMVIAVLNAIRSLNVKGFNKQITASEGKTLTKAVA